VNASSWYPWDDGQSHLTTHVEADEVNDAYLDDLRSEIQRMAFSALRRINAPRVTVEYGYKDEVVRVLYS
jgi:hypothetical protein